MPDITIPMPAGTGKSWAKHVSAIGEEADGRALQGEFLTRGSTYSIGPGELVITVDETKVEGREVRVVTLYRVVDDGWETTKVWTLRGKIGLAILKFLGRRLPESPHKPTLTKAAPERTSPNAKGGKCVACGRRVEPGDGVWREVSRTVQHNQCPPVEPPKPKPAPKPKAADGPVTIVNAREGDCIRCGQTVAPYAGTATKAYRGWDVEHDKCPPNPHNPMKAPTWRVARAQEGLAGVRYVRGTAERVRLPQSVEVPDDAPGLRRRTWEDSIIATVVSAGQYRQWDEDGNSEIPGHDGIVYYAEVRVATAEEAAEILAKEADHRRRANLTAQAQKLFGDSVPRPDDVEFAGERRLPKGAQSVRIDSAIRHWGSRFYVAEDQVWNIRDDGYDEGSTLLVMPLTPERSALVDALREEFGEGL